ncbi:MAG: calcium/sodium antiporter [Roseicyclus sp.]
MADIWLPLLGGLVLLIAGGELLVRGAVNAATHLGVSPLVIGLTLVGFGTSTPELVTSLQAALSGAPGIAYGNIVGSNIANILLIGGIAALLFPIAVTSASLRRDGAIMLAVAVAFTCLGLFVAPGRISGAVFVAALAGYIWLAFRQESAGAAAGHGAVYDKSAALVETDPLLTLPAKPRGPLVIAILTALGGLVLVIFGGRFLVEGAVAMARGFGISEAVIGLTIVAVGTSMPELVTSVVAGLRRQSDVAFGNIIGSNIYNILGIGGATALAAPGPVPQTILAFDAPVMIGVSVLLLVFAASGRLIARWEGAVLLAGYGLYLFLLWP